MVKNSKAIPWVKLYGQKNSKEISWQESWLIFCCLIHFIMIKLGKNRQSLDVNCGKSTEPTAMLRLPVDCICSQDSKYVRH